MALQIRVRFSVDSRHTGERLEHGSAVPEAVFSVHLNVLRVVTSFPVLGIRVCADPATIGAGQ